MFGQYGHAIPGSRLAPMMRHSRSLIACILTFALPITGVAGSLKKVWDIDLTNTIKQNEVDHSDGPPIRAMRFSPDGKRLAVVADRYLSDGEYKSRLLIIQVGSPKSVPAPLRDGGGDRGRAAGPPGSGF
jgi:hypothetical protein